MNELEARKPLRPKEAAEFLGIKLTYLYKLTHMKQIPYYKRPTGHGLYFDKAELEKWVFSNPVPVESKN